MYKAWRNQINKSKKRKQNLSLRIGHSQVFYGQSPIWTIIIQGKKGEVFREFENLPNRFGARLTRTQHWVHGLQLSRRSSNSKFPIDNNGRAKYSGWPLSAELSNYKVMLAVVPQGYTVHSETLKIGHQAVDTNPHINPVLEAPRKCPYFQ